MQSLWTSARPSARSASCGPTNSGLLAPQPASFPPGLLILRRELLARLDLERGIRWQDTVGIHVLVHEVIGIFGDDVALELERRRIQRESLDDVQFVAVREVACQAAWGEADRVDDERVAVPAAD